MALLTALPALAVPMDLQLANAVLQACCRSGDAAAALEVYRLMQRLSLGPDAATYATLMPTLAASGDWSACAQVRSSPTPVPSSHATHTPVAAVAGQSLQPCPAYGRMRLFGSASGLTPAPDCHCGNIMYACVPPASSLDCSGPKRFMMWTCGPCGAGSVYTPTAYVTIRHPGTLRVSFSESAHGTEHSAGEGHTAGLEAAGMCSACCRPCTPKPRWHVWRCNAADQATSRQTEMHLVMNAARRRCAWAIPGIRQLFEAVLLRSVWARGYSRSVGWFTCSAWHKRSQTGTTWMDPHARP